MANAKTTISSWMLAVMASLTFGTSLPGGDATPEQLRQQTDSLLNALRQALRPDQNMRVEWVNQEVDPLRYFKIGQGTPVPQEQARKKIQYAAVMSGLRSRIDAREEVYLPEQSSDEPHTIRQWTSIFDGINQRRFENRLKGQTRTRLVGWQFTEDKNASQLSDELFCSGFYLNHPLAMRQYSFELAESPRPGIYLLDAVDKHQWRRRFTIDADKDFNVTKIECIRKDGSRDWVNNYKLKQYNDGIWFLAECERIRHPRPGRQGDPRIEYRIQVTRAEFNIDVPEDSFSLKFPVGTKVWDEILNSWFIVGGSKEPVIEDASRKPVVAKEYVEAGRGDSAQQQPPDVSAVNMPDPTAQHPNAPSALLLETRKQPSRYLWLLLLAIAAIVFVLGTYVLRRRKPT